MGEMRAINIYLWLSSAVFVYELLHSLPLLRVQIIESKRRLNDRDTLPQMRGENDYRN